MLPFILGLKFKINKYKISNFKISNIKHDSASDEFLSPVYNK